MPLDAGRYHSNDTASSPPPRILHLLKDAAALCSNELVDDRCSQLNSSYLCVLPSLLCNRASNCQPLSPVTPPTVVLHTQKRGGKAHHKTRTRPHCRSIFTMSRPSVMTGGFHHHGVGHGHSHGHSHGHGVAHLGGHYGVHAQSAYGSAAHSSLTFGRPLPIRAPAHPPAFNHQHTGQHQHQHQHPHGRAATFSMADPAFMTAEEEHAYMQKLASEYEPEATVSLRLPCCCSLNAAN